MVYCKNCIHYSICEYRTFLDKSIDCKNYLDKTEYTEAKHAEWVDKIEIFDNGYYSYPIRKDFICSLCGNTASKKELYCCHCGAKMNGGSLND